MSLLVFIAVVGSALGFVGNLIGEAAPDFLGF